MSKPPGSADAQGSSTRPYLIRALHDWCTDNGFTPYVAVFVDRSVQVPLEYVKARFGGVARDIVVPIDHVVAIYARENGQGMAFPAPQAEGAEAQPTPIEARPEPGRGLRLASTDEAPAAPASGPRLLPSETDPKDPAPEPPAPSGGNRPSLKRVK
jgi:stringent starvation protein B